jgi:hypothetical protein
MTLPVSVGVDEDQALAVEDLLDSHDRQRLALAQDHIERSQNLTESYLARGL